MQRSINSQVGFAIVTQRQQKRDKILRTAFEVWGDTNFLSTSLASIAERLDLSKPALYRYFSNKDELVAGMQAQFAEDYRRTAEAWMQWDASAGLESVLASVVRTVFEFLRHEPAYLGFFTEYLLRRAIMTECCLLDSLPVEIRETLARQAKVLSSVLRPASGGGSGAGSRPGNRDNGNGNGTGIGEAGNGAADTEQLLEYIGLATLYWCASYYMSADMRPRRRGADDTPEAAGRHLDMVQELLLDGLWTRPEPPPAERLRAVEGTAWRDPGTVLTEDRVLAAVEAVVAEVGFSEATVERIAVHLGMTKSSLYFHFRNKREMFGELLARENELFLDEYRRIRVALGDSREYLYAYAVLLAAFFAHNPGVFKVVNWLWSQSLEAVELPERYLQRVAEEFAYIEDEIAAGRLRSNEDGWMGVLGFFHVGGVILFAHHLQAKALDQRRLVDSARGLYLLALYGLRGNLDAGDHDGSDRNGGV